MQAHLSAKAFAAACGARLEAINTHETESREREEGHKRRPLPPDELRDFEAKLIDQRAEAGVIRLWLLQMKALAEATVGDHVTVEADEFALVTEHYKASP